MMRRIMKQRADELSKVIFPLLLFKKQNRKVHAFMNKKYRNTLNSSLYESLNKLSTDQFKILYGAFVHYFINHKCFITKQNLLNMWCEINLCCHEMDESFPDQFDDFDLVRSFVHRYPYYFIDRLPIQLIAGLFADHVDNHIDLLTNIAKTLFESGITAAYTYANEALGLEESIDTLVAEAQNHIRLFS